MSGSRRVVQALFIGFIAAFSSVSGQQSCESFQINTLEDLEAARKCPEINGSVTIAYKVPEINLDGVIAIRGNLTTSCIGTSKEARCDRKDVLETISSATLTTVDGNLDFSSSFILGNVSLPQLATVKGLFSLTRLYSLTYLDITRVESVGAIVLQTDNLEILKHETLRKITGWGIENLRFINLSTGGLKSLDSFFQQPLEVDLVEFNSAHGIERLNYGFAKTDALHLYAHGRISNTTLVFGGPNTREVAVGKMAAVYGLWGLERLPSLERLSTGSLSIRDNRCKRLALPFDQLGGLDVSQNSDLEWLSIPPKAKNWTDFSVNIDGSPLLNLSSEYAIDENQEAVRFWYWPQSKIGSIIINANLRNNFFNSFLSDRQSASVNTTQPWVTGRFSLRLDDAATSFDCTPFKNLSDQGSLPSGKNFTCTGLYSSSEDGGSSGNSSDGSSEKSLGSLCGVSYWAWLAWAIVGIGML